MAPESQRSRRFNMADIFSRIHSTLSSITVWFETRFTRTETVFVNMDQVNPESDESEETNVKTNEQQLAPLPPNESHKQRKNGKIDGSSKVLELCTAPGRGFLTEEALDTVLRRHPRTKIVTKLSVVHQATLVSIPEIIGAFENLTILNLSANSLHTLPWSVMYLRHLWHLNLSQNKFQSLPPILGHLTSLQELLLADNLLEYLPTSLLHLTELSLLEVAGNQCLVSPSLDVCSKGIHAVRHCLEQRLDGRRNLWQDSKPFYTETSDQVTYNSDTGFKSKTSNSGNVQVKSLLEMCVATILTFQVDFVAHHLVPPPLKRHLSEKTKEAMSAVKLCRCSRCLGYFSNQIHFESHVCRGTFCK